MSLNVTESKHVSFTEQTASNRWITQSDPRQGRRRVIKQDKQGARNSVLWESES